VPALLALTSNPFGLPVPNGNQAMAASPSVPLLQADFPLVRYWNRSDWTKGDGISKNSGPKLHGATLVSQGINVSAKYIEDKTGNTVDGFRSGQMVKVAAQIWFGLVEKGLAPRTWGQASLEVITLYNNEMCQHFPELRFCADNWKAQQIATANYSSWHKTHGDRSDTATALKKGKQRHRSGSPPPLEVRKKVKLDDTALLVRSSRVCDYSND
jgi:hypothetical protein